MPNRKKWLSNLAGKTFGAEVINRFDYNKWKSDWLVSLGSYPLSCCTLLWLSFNHPKTLSSFLFLAMSCVKNPLNQLNTPFPSNPVVVLYNFYILFCRETGNMFIESSVRGLLHPYIRKMWHGVCISPMTDFRIVNLQSKYMSLLRLSLGLFFIL